MNSEIKVQDDALCLNQDYKHFLTDIKTRLQTAHEVIAIELSMSSL